MLQKTCTDTVVVQAQDYERIPKTGRFQRIQGHHGNVCKTSLSRSLHIGVNARVMLLKNIDTSQGLVSGVNGAFGSVSEICFNPEEEFPTKIYVTFDNEKAGRALRAKMPCVNQELQKGTAIEPKEERVTKVVVYGVSFA